MRSIYNLYVSKLFIKFQKNYAPAAEKYFWNNPSLLTKHYDSET